MGLDLVLAALAVFATVTEGESFNLTILHTNDVHSRVEESNKYGSQCSQSDKNDGKCYGGFARLRTIVRKKKAGIGNTILLDGGDQFQGTLWFFNFGGTLIARFMNIVGYDAMAVGNHEFDDGLKGLLSFAKGLDFPLLSSNMDLSKTPTFQGIILKSTVLDVGGEDIGVVGYTTTETSYISQSETIMFKEELESVQAEVDVLTSQGINKIIALGHAGFHMDKYLGQNLRDVDVIVGGHTNTFLYSGEAPSNDIPVDKYPYVAENEHHPQGVLIVQDYAFGKYIGELDVTFDDKGEVTGYSGNPILLNNSIVKDLEISSIIEENMPKLTVLRNKVIGQSHVMMQHRICRQFECNLGNLVADAMVRQNLRHSDSRYWSDVSIAIINSGGFRADVLPGPITMETAIEVLPFRNTVDVIEVSGHTLWKILEHSANKWDEKSGRFLQVSGLQMTYQVWRPRGQRLVKVLATCSKCQVPKLEPLRKDENYKILLPNFIKNGGDDYSMIQPNIISETVIGDLMADILVEYINVTTPVFTGLQNRVIVEKDFVDPFEMCNVFSAGLILLPSAMTLTTILMVFSMIEKLISE